MSNENNGDTEERKYFLQVLSTFESYKRQSLLRLEFKEKCLNALPARHKEWLSKYQTDLNNFKECIAKNGEFLPVVLQHANNIFENVYCNENSTHSETEVGTLAEGLDKVQSVFKQLMRDWSALGEDERKQCYGPIIDEIEVQYPADKVDRDNIYVLVPGAALGRLAFEIATRGFACQGNEFNMFMLIVSFYVLNHCKTVNAFSIYPWIHQYCNNLCADHEMLSVSFPDVLPTLASESRFSMTAGDFLEVYTLENEWHCVATCFFIDCASNIVEFIETIYKIVKPGGIWINIGPLLYHYSDIKNHRSVEPSFEVVCEVIKHVGFEMEKSEIGVKTKYCQNPKSMLQYEYDSVFFVCRKPILVSNNCNGEQGSVENGC